MPGNFSNLRPDVSLTRRQPSAEGTVRAADPPLLFEYGGWALYTLSEAHRDAGDREGNCLTHIGCGCVFPNWAISFYIWAEYSEGGSCRLICTECAEVLPKKVYEMFCRVYKLLNKS